MRSMCLCSITVIDYTPTVQICSGITRGRVLNLGLYAQRLQKLIYLHLFTDCLMKISLQSLEQIFAFVYRLFHEDFIISGQISSNDWREIFMKQSEKNCR